MSAGGMHLGALGEGADPAVQERARGAGQRVVAVRAVEPEHVRRDGHDPGHEQGDQTAPACPAGQHGHQDHDEQRLADRPHQGGVADEQPGDRHDRDRGAVVPAQDHHGDGAEEDEQRVRGDHVLEVQFVRVEQDGQRGQDRPPPGQAAVAQQRVDGHAHGHAHGRLEHGQRVGVVQRQQQVEEEGVAVRPDAVRDVGHGVVDVVVRVVEPQDRRVDNDHVEPHHDGRGHDHGELPVRHRRAGQPGQPRAPLRTLLRLRRLLIGNDPIAAGGRVRQRPPPASSSQPEIL